MDLEGFGNSIGGIILCCFVGTALILCAGALYAHCQPTVPL